MKYKYQARTKDGELQVGNVESFSKEGAVNILTSHGLFLLSLESAEEKHWYDGIVAIFKRIKLDDLVIFTRQFSTLIESKVPLGDALKNLSAQTENPMLKQVIYEIASDVNSGLSLSQALEHQGNVFDEFFVSMIRSAELTGRLEESLAYLATYLEKQKLWRSRIVNALIYPIMLIVGFILVIILMAVVVFPNIKPIFLDSNVTLPWFTQLVLFVGDFIVNWWWAMVLILVPITIMLVDYFRSKEGKAVLDEILFRLPIFGKLLRKMYISRFAESLSVLIKGGVPIAQSLIITSNSIGSTIFQEVLYNISEKVRSGELLSNSLREESFYFPPLVSQMVGIGETTGRLEELLGKVANYYNGEVEDLIDRLTELIQPIVIAFIGVFIGLLFASILVPIYNLIQGFKA